VPLLIHQPSYSMLNRWIEGGLLDTLGDLGIGCIAFSPLAQGMLTSKYLGGIPDDARAVRGRYFPKQALTEETLGSLRALDALARERGQTLAQMAIAWALRDPRVTSALIGARTVGQLEDSLAALRGLEFRGEELARIDELAGDAGINIWQASSSIEAF
jgi:L-glyceraldehyde 3-phosphate reductase